MRGDDDAQLGRLEPVGSLDDDFAAFVRANTSTLLRTAYLFAGDATSAEELVQDTFVRLYPRWDLVRAAAAPLAYVRRSLANQFVNQTRRPWRRELTVQDLPERPDDRDATSQLDDRDELWSLLRTLPDRQRTALVLRFFHDLPDEEIGAALGCRLGTVRSLISRGLAGLRELHGPDARFPGAVGTVGTAGTTGTAGPTGTAGTAGTTMRRPA